MLFILSWSVQLEALNGLFMGEPNVFAQLVLFFSFLFTFQTINIQFNLSLLQSSSTQLQKKNMGLYNCKIQKKKKPKEKHFKKILNPGKQNHYEIHNLFQGRQPSCPLSSTESRVTSQHNTQLFPHIFTIVLLQWKLKLVPR